MINRLILCGVLTLILLSSAFSVNAGDNTVNTQTSGGDCAYKQYEGYGEITAINQRSVPNSDSYEVKFLFHPDREISEGFAQVEGKEVLFLTKTSSYPTATYLQENGIEVGMTFDCILKVIVKGTCTPIIFEFPSFTD